VKTIGNGVVAVQADVSVAKDLDRLYADGVAEVWQNRHFVCERRDLQICAFGGTLRRSLRRIVRHQHQRVYFTPPKALPHLMTALRSLSIPRWRAKLECRTARRMQPRRPRCVRSPVSIAAELVERGIRVNAVSPGTDRDTGRLPARALQRSDGRNDQRLCFPGAYEANRTARGNRRKLWRSSRRRMRPLSQALRSLSTADLGKFRHCCRSQGERRGQIRLFGFLEDHLAPPEGSGDVAVFTSRSHERAMSSGA